MWEPKYYGQAALALLAIGATVREASAENTPGYPEPVLQWHVEEGETCDDVAVALYGAPQHRGLVERYNDVRCTPGVALAKGQVLVVPATVTVLPAANLRAMQPQVRAKPPSGDWSSASPGQPLVVHHTVNTLQGANADILFVDRSRVVLGEHTLVVIYGTASRSAVSKTTPAAVELEQGEVQAGLAALRGGRSIGVAVGGGSVSAQSRDTVVRRKADRSTVSVFDGQAAVASAGRTVTVPTGQGTSFVKAQPPAPPRPLPPAPDWAAGAVSGVALLGPSGALEAAWNAVPGARSYRVEVARDAAFVELVLREEVPAAVTRLRAERLPPATYFLRVRAIDGDDFLGLASVVREVTLVGVAFPDEGGAIEGTTLTVSPYAAIRLVSGGALELALDQGPFGPLPEELDLARTAAPAALRLRRSGGGDVTSYRVVYRETRAALALVEAGGGSQAVATFPDVTASFVEQRIQPRVRLVPAGAGEAARELPLVAGAGGFTVSVPTDRAWARLELLDRHGAVLAAAVPPAAPAPLVAPVAAAPPRPPGVSVPLTPLHREVSLSWWAPAPRDAIVTDLVMDVSEGIPDAAVRASAVGRWGRFAFDARVDTPSFRGEGERGDGSAWLGSRWLALGEEAGGFQFGPALRVGLPTTVLGPPVRPEGALGVGGVDGPWTWLVDLGARLGAVAKGERVPVSPLQAFALLGGTYDFERWLRGYALLDTHGLVAREEGPLRVRGGLTVGAELGDTLFGSLGVRATPWTDAGGWFAGQVGVGVRAP